MSEPDKYRIAAGEKAEEYGHPAEFYALSGSLFRVWNRAYRERCERVGAEGQYEQVMPDAVRMILWKVARLVHSPRKRDTIDDICGYAETLHMMLDREEGDGS